MAEERRGGRRAPISGVRVTYEGATGAKIEADVLDLATGGLFIRTEAPLATGKRIALDLHILGEPGPWSALGRVVWTRTPLEPGSAGMGVKLIDVDDATIDVLSRLVETREPTAPGVGKVAPVTTAPIVSLGGAGAPERERTLMGVGIAEPEPSPPHSPAPPFPAPAAHSPPPATPAPAPPPVPAAVVATAPEATPAEVSPAADVPLREQSIAIDLIATKKEVVEAPAAPLPIVPTAARQAESGAGSARWVVVVLLLVVAAIAAYVLFDGFLKPMGR